MSTPKGRGHHANVVYAAEADVRRMARNGDRTITPIEARALFGLIVGQQGQRTAKAMPTLRFYTSQNRGTGWARYWSGEVRLNRKGLTASIVIHELAHIYCPDDKGHGAPFRAEYLRLAAEYLPTYATRLRNALRRRGIEVPR